MTVTSIITAIVIGSLVGVVGRLVVPGRRPISIGLTTVAGTVAAFGGTFVARALGLPTATNGIDWLELLAQVVVAAIGVSVVGGLRAPPPPLPPTRHPRRLRRCGCS